MNITTQPDPGCTPDPGEDLINHPAHYRGLEARCWRCGGSIECIDVAAAFNFCMGAAIKYIWRADFKGDPIEDLKKAVWYLNKEIDRREKKKP